MKMSSVVHFEMPYKDKKRMGDFYSKVFGWKMIHLGEELGDYVLAQTAPTADNGRPTEPGTINGGFFERKEEAGFQYPSLVIGVEDINLAVEEIKNAGGKVVVGPEEIPGIGTFISMVDPEGNRVGVLQPSASMA